MFGRIALYDQPGHVARILAAGIDPDLADTFTATRTVWGSKDEFDTSSMTFVSSWANPPCSASFAVLPGVCDADIRGRDRGVRRARI